MRDGAALSGIFHCVVIGVMVIGLPWSVDPLAQTVIPIEMILFEEKEPEPKPEPEQMAEEVAPEPEPPKQEAKAVPAPVAPEPEPEPEPEPLPEVKPEPEPESEPEKLVKPPPPKPKRRPDIKVAMPDKHKKKEPPKPDQLTSILRNVEKLRDQATRRREPMAKAQIQGAANLSASALEQNEMARAIQAQLRNCWRIDPGARGAADIVIEIKVLLNQDGSVRRVDIVDVVRMVQDGFFRSAAENAKRAINRCSPFQLPPRKYDIWRQLTLRFDPRQMFGT